MKMKEGFIIKAKGKSKKVKRKGKSKKAKVKMEYWFAIIIVIGLAVPFLIDYIIKKRGRIK
jgi:hypothetical protein